MAEKSNDLIHKLEEDPLNRPKIMKQPRKKTLKAKLVEMKDNITVEPLLAGLLIPSMISRFAMANLNLDKACRVNKGFSSEICDALIKKSSGNYSFYEKEVQKLIASIDIWKGIIHTALPCVIIMFLGAWSDRTGKRKICILLPIFGELLTSISNLINVYFFYEIPVEVTVFLETTLTSISGGWMTIFIGVFSYITDITSEETRTFRVGLVNFCMTAGLPIGVGLSGFLLQKMGYYGVFSLTLVLFVITLVYGFMNLKEPDQWLKEKGDPVVERPKNDAAFFDLSHMRETIAVVYRPRAADRRIKVVLTLFCVFILFGPTISEQHIYYLFVRNQLNWDLVKHSIFISFFIVLHSIGAIFSITVLNRKLKMDDALLCTVSVFSKFVGSVWTAFVTTDLGMYIVPILELLHASTFTTLRSIISKVVEKDETAKVNSLFSLAETVAALMFHPFYSWTYMRTLTVFPGTVFMISAALTIPAMIILMFFYIRHKREVKKARSTAFKSEKYNAKDIRLSTTFIEQNDQIDQVSGSMIDKEK
ncbi:hypothetical protein MSG28_007410 [Choristoneura fumiferana]|uniref:Uncharacterized protein n=1 Tax=Choristoneura fumiferana TaxID=7141 RepID=A0ACC0JXQ5_CHOFU|nr:hypothetical protein MSG28_007410 [Choristoneura fumiferana]